MNQTNEASSSLRVLILGGTGMLGHKLWQTCRDQFDTFSTARSSSDSLLPPEMFDPNRTIPDVVVEDFDSVVRALAVVRPAVVVNCVGIVKQRPLARDPLSSIVVNAAFPHRLARQSRASGARLIHLSTDCVFSGQRGGYDETDAPDPVDLYGRSKLLGEVDGEGCLTLRTSMIGRELATSQGLVEWFLGHRNGSAHGYTQALFSGLTTRALAEVIVWIIVNRPAMDGVWHVGAAPIAKFALLTLIRDAFNLDVELIPDTSVVIDRSLDSTRFVRETGWSSPTWSSMIEEMALDLTPYDNLRRLGANR